jgi:predicted PhzF superfamily epimerase YddE/YHI9
MTGLMNSDTVGLKMELPIFYLDAFTSEVFKGNPAAVLQAAI